MNVPGALAAGQYTVVLVPAAAAGTPGALPAGSLALPPGMTLQQPVPPPLHPRAAAPPPPAHGARGGRGGGGGYGAPAPVVVMPPGSYGAEAPGGADALYGAAGMMAYGTDAGAEGAYALYSAGLDAHGYPLLAPAQHAPPAVQAPKPRRTLKRKANWTRDDAAHVYVTPSEAELASRRSYQCACCLRYCANPQALKKHLRSHGADGAAALAATEAAEAAAAAGEGPGADGRATWYYCPAPGCNHNPGVEAAANPFKTLRNLRDHYQTAHNAAVAECACAKCGKGFKVKSRMQSHQKHCGDVFRCSCACTFRERRSLSHHLNLFPEHFDAGRVNAAGELVAPPPGGEGEAEGAEGEVAAPGEGDGEGGAEGEEGGEEGGAAAEDGADALQ